MKRKSEESSDKDEIPEFFLDKEEKNEQSKEKVPSSISSVKKKLSFKKPSGLLNKQPKIHVFDIFNHHNLVTWNVYTTAVACVVQHQSLRI